MVRRYCQVLSEGHQNQNNKYDLGADVWKKYIARVRKQIERHISMMYEECIRGEECQRVLENLSASLAEDIKDGAQGSQIHLSKRYGMRRVRNSER
jgi:hypothetical protein